jgi:hypothetical protein
MLLERGINLGQLFPSHFWFMMYVAKNFNDWKHTKPKKVVKKLLVVVTLLKIPLDD